MSDTKEAIRLKLKRLDWEKELRHFPLNPKGVPAKLKQTVEERIAMGATPKRYRGGAWAAAAVMLIAAAVLYAERETVMSLFRQEKDELPFDVSSERSIKVHWIDGMSFMSRYGEAFIIQHPNMDVETINSPPYDPQKDRTAQFEEMIDRDKPDIVYLTTDIYRQMAEKGKLLSLETFIGKDKYDLNGFHDGVLEALREAGGGKLYGFAPDFQTNALYYNKSLFDKYGIPYPTDKMTWEDVFRLAQRFPADGEGDNRITGLSSSLLSASAYATAETAGSTLGLSLISSDGDKMTADTPAWKSIWQFVEDGVKKGWLYEAKPRTGSISGIDYYKRYPFATGTSAMMVGQARVAYELIEAKKRYQLADFAWDIVTEPVDPAKPNMASSFSFDGIYAIPAQSTNARDAWEMLKLIHSDSIAKKVAAQYSGGLGLSTRKSVTSSSNGYHMEAFSALKPDPETRFNRNAILSRDVNTAISTAINEEIKAAAAGTKSLEAAINAIQQRGQQAIEQAKAAQKP
ncbi:extracellular solute-binding protein [Paenibacillus mesophilus]|nr:extracellular solute-binding protein [Paenibacillus mesophilus]